MVLHLPQLILLALYSVELGMVLAYHGQPKTGRYNFSVTFFAIVLNLSILYWGGFFGG